MMNRVRLHLHLHLPKTRYDFVEVVLRVVIIAAILIGILWVLTPTNAENQGNCYQLTGEPGCLTGNPQNVPARNDARSLLLPDSRRY